MGETANGGDLVAEVLQACGVTTAFGVVSVHNIPMLDAIGRRNRIRFVMARGEMGAGHMADGYARIAGALGVLITSNGGGAANAASALVEARIAGSPVLHLTGATATAHLDRGHGTSADVPDQLGMLKAVSKAAYRVRAPEALLGTLRRAIGEALTPPMGPVSVEIPIDIQRAAIARPAAIEAVAPPLPLSADPVALDRLADIVASARRPLLWLGSGAREAGAAARRLLDLGFCAVASYNGRGIVSDDDPRSLGAFTGRHTPAVEAFYETVDLMVVAGARLRGYETKDLTLKLPQRRVQIDVDPLAEGRTYSCDYFVRGDATLALAGLADRLGGRLIVDSAFQAEVAALKQQVRDGFRATLGVYADFPAQLRAAMTRDAIWIRDVTSQGGSWGSRLFPVYGPRDSLFSVGGALGLGLPLGIGAALASGRKAVILCGDGGLALALAELWTAVQEKADLLLIVMNDRGYGVIKDIQDQLYGGRHYFTALAGPDLAQLATLAGLPYRKVGRADEFAAAVTAMMVPRGPAMVEVDVSAIGPLPAHWQPPPYAAKR